MNVGSDPWIDSDAHCIFLPYCDGASFSGFRPEPWAVPGKNTTVTFRGIKNLDATVEWALAHGLDKATQFVLTGGSAGGLSTFLHADRVIAKVRAASPAVVAWAAPVVGYFLDHDNFAHSSGTPNTPSFTHANYTTWMKYVYAMQNLTFGADGGLTAACEAKHADAPYLCFMSPHMVDVVKAPLYIFNSKYDAWQLANELQTDWGTRPEQDAVRQYGVDFLSQLTALQANPKNGGFITSCICHGCPWADLTPSTGSKVTTYDCYIKWANDPKWPSSSEPVTIDARGPNGGGDITFSECSPFPPSPPLVEA